RRQMPAATQPYQVSSLPCAAVVPSGQSGGRKSGRLDRSPSQQPPAHRVGLARRSQRYRQVDCECDMRNCDQVEIIESAYSLEVPDVQWQYRLTDLVADRWGGAAASFLYDASGPSQLICG